MGQKIGRLPNTWSELTEEKNRVLQWSSEVLRRIDDNIENEDRFLKDYSDSSIDTKIDRWFENQRFKWESQISKMSCERSRNLLKNEISAMKADIGHKMRRDYREAYSKMKKFSKMVDELGMNQRKLHRAILDLENLCENDEKIFIDKFGPLRKKVHENLLRGEKIQSEEKSLKVEFTRKIYRIDRKYIEECAGRIDNLVKDFQRSERSSE